MCVCSLHNMYYDLDNMYYALDNMYYHHISIAS
jgi:hypothetical protein